MLRFGFSAIALLLVVAACAEPPTAVTPTDPIGGQPPPPTPEAAAKAVADMVVAETDDAETAVEEAVVAEAAKESAFDANQWNSAIGLGSGASGRAYGGRRGTRSAETYASFAPSGFLLPEADRMSTFAADVDTASFTNVLRQLKAGQVPIKDSVRLEEFVNAMRYDLPSPGPRQTFAIDSEVTKCPWNNAHELVRIAISTLAIETDKLPPCNLVFLVDVSGSMRSAGKLPLLKQAFGLLIDQLRPQDRASMVTYAAGVSVPVEGARGDEKARLHAAVQQLKSSGGTNGAGAIQAAYEFAVKHRVLGINRVLLATDGDFNIGIRSADELETFISEKKDLGVFLSVLGFGTGNLKDDRLERLANRGNGVYSYIDDVATARRVLIEGFGASMMTIAKDVKLQTEWNPKMVARFRLLGYENRALATKDFKDDKKDGGEVGAGHSVTALYEIERAAKVAADATAGSSEPLATLRIRYKPPEGQKSLEVDEPIRANADDAPLSSNGRIAATAAAIAMHLREDEHRGSITAASLLAMTKGIDAKLHPELHELVAAMQPTNAVAQPGSRLDEK